MTHKPTAPREFLTSHIDYEIINGEKVEVKNQGYAIYHLVEMSAVQELLDALELGKDYFRAVDLESKMVTLAETRRMREAFIEKADDILTKFREGKKNE